jgi:hypothetical protein
MDLTGNTLSHANTCEGGNTPEVLLVLETTTSYYVEIGRDGTIYVPDPDGKSLDGSMTMAENISCADCGARRAFTGLHGDYNPQIRWGSHAPTLENTIIKAMLLQQPNTPVNMRMVERLASEIQASWLIQPTVQEQELQEKGV